MEFEKLLAQLGNILEKMNLNYCITGGYAVSVWGKVRSTIDIDVIIQLEKKDIAPLAQELRKTSRAGYIDEDSAKKEIEKGGEFNFIHSESGIKIDFWTIRKNDHIGIGELQRRIKKEMFGQGLYFISPEDLILSKLRWSKMSTSTRHLEDIQSVLDNLGDKLDREYLKKQAKAQGVEEALKSFL